MKLCWLAPLVAVALCTTGCDASGQARTVAAARSKASPPGAVEVACPPQDTGGLGVANPSAPKRGWSTPEEALRRYMDRSYTYPLLRPDASDFERAAERPRWVPLVFRPEDRILAVVRTFKSSVGWSVRYVYACDSAVKV
jgi:hypothetical protein